MALTQYLPGASLLFDNMVVISNGGDGGAVIPINRTLKALPGLRHDITHFSGELDTLNIIERSKVFQRNPVVQTMMIDTWDRILNTLEHRPVNVLSKILWKDLERSFVDDASAGMDWDAPFIPTLAMFVCLSEISTRTRSTLIGTVLCQFFRAYGLDILEADPGAMPEWGIAIQKAKLDRTDKKELLSAIASWLPSDRFPDSGNPIQYPQSAYEEFMRTMRRLRAGLYEDDILGTSYGDNGLSRSRRARRPQVRRHRSAPPLATEGPRYYGRELGIHDDTYRSMGSRHADSELQLAVRRIDDGVGDLSEQVRGLRDMLRHGRISHLPGFFEVL